MSQHRQAILVSGGPHHQQGKLLTVPTLADGTGRAQAEAMLDALEDWGVTDQVVGLCFDTTAANTGRVNGAVARLQGELDRSLLLLACRHHVMELVVKAVATMLFGPTTGPTDKKFEDVKARYGHSICLVLFH